MRISGAWIIVTLAVWAVSGGGLAAPAADMDPQAVMEELSAQLFTALEGASRVARHDPDKVMGLIDQVLGNRFDQEYAGRLALGQLWRSATPEQRQAFAAALYRRLLRTYAGNVAGWTADRVRILPLQRDPAALQVTVHTEIKNPGAATAPVDFRLHQTAEGWKIFDVVVEGVSYVRIYHDDTEIEATQKGLDAAIARLQQKDARAYAR